MIACSAMQWLPPYLHGSVKGESNVRVGYSIRGDLVHPSGWENYGVLESRLSLCSLLLVSSLLGARSCRCFLWLMRCSVREPPRDVGTYREQLCVQALDNWSLISALLMVLLCQEIVFLQTKVNRVTSVITAGWGAIGWFDWKNSWDLQGALTWKALVLYVSVLTYLQTLRVSHVLSGCVCSPVCVRVKKWFVGNLISPLIRFCGVLKPISMNYYYYFFEIKEM